MAFFRQHVVGKMRFQVSVFRFQDFAARLPDTRNLKPFTTQDTIIRMTLEQEPGNHLHKTGAVWLFHIP